MMIYIIYFMSVQEINIFFNLVEFINPKIEH